VLREVTSTGTNNCSIGTRDRGRTFMELWQARYVQNYVTLHLHSKIKLVDLMRVTHLSQNKFYRAFKASFGCTPYRYVMRMRLDRAQHLMVMSRESLGQIAVECGFFDQSHFSRCFLNVVGHSPGLWRRQHCPDLQAKGGLGCQKH
jgi:AraC family transcriptional regulator